jgi:hypothetical protein
MSLASITATGLERADAGGIMKKIDPTVPILYRAQAASAAQERA